VRYADKIKTDFRLKGTALTEVDRYVTGSNYVTKHNINRHLNGLAHKLGHKKEADLLTAKRAPTTISSLSVEKRSSCPRSYNKTLEQHLGTNIEEHISTYW